jgi:uncharacterized protein (TIGR00251 family)
LAVTGSLPPWLRVGQPEGGLPTLTVAVAVQPGAKKSAVAGLHGDRLKIKVAAPPVDGAANEALVEFLAKTLGVRAAQVSLIQGAAGRQKVLRIVGLDPAVAVSRLAP